MLVFSPHSTEDVPIHFDTETLIKNVDFIKDRYKFNTAILCLYYKDIMLGRNEIYEDSGYLIACAGRREKHYFYQDKEL